MTDAYLLVTHGSRDPRPQIAASQLAQQVATSLLATQTAGKPVVVGTAQLELSETPLHVQIGDFASKYAQHGIERVVVLPLFLIPGVHAIEDIPAEVALANARGQIQSILAPFLGSHPDLANVFAQNRSGSIDRTMILAHGSRRSGGNQPVEDLAARLGVHTAYWSVPPSLTDRVTELIATGADKIEILPYFLFAGGITDAIAAAVAQLRTQLPQVELTLGEPIGNSPELVTIICNLLLDSFA
ncbi:sirohydrochlorin chelatase [Chamaesiphon sp. VAR_69_metabat_338]|uniref:sirohydrochlorin chelatase n=1 Tax=Chamaesiphon sp. VAR_69_metabat_338 TaxID=2964704 RepID=UPI00286DA9B3|nr:sirohydrochlorin chelatase [Chamaesiphon sp. VAR_69_metabat_338]